MLAMCTISVMSNERKIFPLNQIATYLGVRPKWLVGEAEARRIPALRAGTQWIGEISSIQDALLRQIPNQSNGEAVGNGMGAEHG